MKKVTDKIDQFLKESDFAAKFPNNQSKYKGIRPAQFLQWWNNFRPGDRVDIEFGDGYISIVGTNAEGQFAGVKKDYTIEDDFEAQDFKAAEGRLWFFV